MFAKMVPIAHRYMYSLLRLVNIQLSSPVMIGVFPIVMTIRFYCLVHGQIRQWHMNE